jgi:hypothetical protein
MTYKMKEAPIIAGIATGVDFFSAPPGGIGAKEVP